MTRTKKPKIVKVFVIEEPYVRIWHKYQCPSCRRHFELKSGIDENITRFKCYHCGQELIIDWVIEESGK